MELLKRQKNKNSGFTIVELLVVIVVIAILAAVTVVSYTGVSGQANISKYKSDLVTLSKAIQMARVSEGKTLLQITGNGYTASGCVSLADGTDLAALGKTTSSCWISYLNTLGKISDASGVNVRDMVDPWGRPYRIDENEGEGGTSCARDSLAVYKNPFVYGGASLYAVYIPLSGYTGCT